MRYTGGSVPLPPPLLADRVLGEDRSAPDYDPVGLFDTHGAEAKRTLLDLLGSDFSFEGRRFLDFGCGAGKLLRHLLPEAETAEIYGCDIDDASISWLQRHLSPPLHVFVNGVAPPLPLPDTHFDVIYASSVLTHLTDHWSAWLIELHRLLKDDGLIIASFIGESMSEAVAGEPWSDDEIGMTVFDYGTDFAEGRQGPMVLHSEWWIREHWGRIFDIESLIAGVPGEQGIVTLRKKAVTLRPAELERADPGEPRELYAAQRQIRQLELELLRARRERDDEVRRRHEPDADRTLPPPEEASPIPPLLPDRARLAPVEGHLAALAARLERGAAEPPPPGSGAARRFARATLLRLLRPHTIHQEHINQDVLATLASLTAALADTQPVTASSPAVEGQRESSAVPSRSSPSTSTSSS